MSHNKHRIIVITGPTAAGKTKLAVNLASLLGAEIVSADSMQVYRYMDIGTAKPSKEEMGTIAHHMIDIAHPAENYSVARYVAEALPVVDAILRRDRIPILAGGTGLYIDSLIRGRSFSPGADPQLRMSLEQEYDRLGGSRMLCQLRRLDPARAMRLHENDKKRIVRAFEVIKTTGSSISRHDDAEKALPARYNPLFIALNYSDRAVLYDAINRRTDLMISSGLVDEVRKLLDMGVSRQCTSMQAIGYKEIAAALGNPDYDLSEAISKIKMESRRYAKRQLTWLRRCEKKYNFHWINRDAAPDIDEAMQIAKDLYYEAQ